jgi:DNA polymerase-3 subunit epsilon
MEDLSDLPLSTAEFLAVDTETNGRMGDTCEITEIGAVLVGGGELHDRWETLVATRAPLSRGIQRFTGITQEMVDAAPPAEATLPDLAAQLDGRVLVAHSAAFDVRVLRQAFGRAGLAWPDPPVLCTVALARRLHPLARQRKLAPLAASLGIEVETTHRALADAETCARVFCALFARLCAQAGTVGEALAVLKPVRARRARAGATDGGPTLRGLRKRAPDCSHLPDEPGAYLVRNAEGQVLYVGKSVSLRKRVRAHFAASSPATAWALQAETVDHEVTASELGALLAEHRLIRRHHPPGNVVRKHEDPFVYLRCRLDIPFPILEVAPEPASGHAVSVGPLASRPAAVELMEQLNSLFGLRRCGRRLARRDHPSAYGQMGRCLSPCLGDLDPNLYRRRLDEALALFTAPSHVGVHPLVAHVDRQMRAAALDQAYERAGWLQRRRRRLVELLDQLGGVLEAAGARPRLVLAPHPRDPERGDLLWLARGRVVGWDRLGRELDLEARAAALVEDAVGAAPAHLAPEDVAEQRLVATWLATNAVPTLDLAPPPSARRIAAFVWGVAPAATA